jgi:heme/copper-type cytochrome/quinol oxidase subunit 3
VWWLLASEIVIFGGVLASYLMHRVGHPEWANQAVHTNVCRHFNTFVLLTSSLTAVLAHRRGRAQGDGPKAASTC